jgi:hypothetical protein
MAVTPSTNMPLQRSFALLRRLQRGPATLDELVAYVHISIDAGAYADIAQKAGHKRFEKEPNDATRKTPALAALSCHSPLSTTRAC